MTYPVLDVRNLRVEFQTDHQRITAVDGISFQVEAGQTLGIVGESGSGKSVTALAVMGLIAEPGQITSGQILFCSSPSEAKFSQPIDLRQLTPRQVTGYRGSQMAMIFQEPMSSLNPVYTIGFQLIETLITHQKMTVAQAKQRAIELLQEVKLLPSDEVLQEQGLSALPTISPTIFNVENLPAEIQATLQRQRMSILRATIERHKRAMLNRYPHQLSGGQIQRVMVAMAIACNPALLIADEPTTALDVTVQATILDLLRQLRDSRQMATVFISHDLGVIAGIADVVAVMYQGKIVEVGPIQQIFRQPQHPYTRGLLACRPRPEVRLNRLPTIADFMASGVPPASQNATNGQASPAHPLFSEISAQAVAQRLQHLQKHPPLLTVDSLRVTFPVKGVWGLAPRRVTVVNQVSFQVYPGETLGLVGESGCGKTTLARTLLQLLPPTAGRISFDGQDVTQLSRQRSDRLQKLRQEMQMIFQNPFGALDPRMSVGEAVMEPLRIHRRGNARSWPDRAVELLERVGLSAQAMSRYPHEFSGGQRQRICIARALTLNPRLIICDESVSALDVSVQAQVLNLLKDLQEELGLTYIFISHDLAVVKYMSDRIMVMNQGQIEEIGPADQIYHSPQQDYTRQLIASIPKIHVA